MSNPATPTNVQWHSRLGFILASAGSAVGLGALWKFPYWAGANGGAAFILPYIFFTLTSGLALVMAEIALGRHGRGSVVTAMRRTGGRLAGAAGAFSVLTSFVILSYYSVVGGWCLAYLGDALVGRAVSGNVETLREHFATLVSTGWLNVSWHLVFLTLTCAVVMLGVEKGIERLSKVLMPALFILMLVLTVAGLFLDGAWEGVRYLFDIHWSDITSQSVLNAMGYSFFSLSLGAGILVTYGTYLPERACIPTASLWIAVLSIVASLLAGLMTMPAVFAFGLAPNAGPGLVFLTVPLIFSKLPGGILLAILFYASLLVTAITSSVSLLEVVVAYLRNNCHLTRRASTVMCWAGLLVLGAVSALSFSAWSGLTIFGRGFFDLLDYISTNFLMPLGGLAVVLLMGWKAWPVMRSELLSARTFPKAVVGLMHFLIAFLAPLLVLCALLQAF